jgi:hypothetical protein
MRERIEKELELVEARYGALERAADLSWFVIEHWPLPAGWSAPATRLLLLIPSGYPATPPDNFAIENGITAPGGVNPNDLTGEIDHTDRRWMQFSWHVTDGEAGWRPHAEVEKGDNILSFLLGAQTRLEEGA